MSVSGSVSGELLRPEGLRRDSVLGSPVVRVELLVQDGARDARVIFHLLRQQIRECSVSTAVSMGTSGQHVRDRR